MSLAELKKDVALIERRMEAFKNKGVFNMGEEEGQIGLKEKREKLLDEIDYLENKEMRDRIAEIEAKQKKAHDEAMANEEGVIYENEIRNTMKPSEIHTILTDIFDSLSSIPSEHLAQAVQADELKEDWQRIVKQAQIVFKHVPKSNSYRIAVLELFNNTFRQNVEFEYVEIKKEKAGVPDETPEEVERRELIEKLKRK